VTRILVALGCLLALPQVVAAQSDTTRLGLRLGFGYPVLRLQQPAVLRAPWMGAPRVTPALQRAAFDSTLTQALAADRAARLVGLRLATLYGIPFQPVDSLQEGLPAERRNPLGLPSKYADLSLDGQARLEIRTDRVREEQCTPALSVDPSSGCRGSFRTPSLDNQVNIRSTGVLGRRVHVNVDFDTEREYTSNNEFQVYYEGLQDEIVRRVDVGTVIFQPPPSRFITAAVPANNFGVNAVFDFGPLQFQTLAATQKGSVMAERTYAIGQTTSQAQDRQVRDLDFEAGRFFWVVDPDSVPGTPAVDILELDPATIPATYRPTEVRLYRYRATSGSTGINPNLGGITASARRGDGQPPLQPVRWELLIQGTDYYLDGSGLWVVLATKLDRNDYLATSFRTTAGNTIGTFPEVDQGTTATHPDTLELIAEPQQTQTSRTFRHEMRNVYRVAGSDLDPSSLEVGITLNRSEAPVTGAAQTYLQLLGLAVPNDPQVFDGENRLWPRARDPEAVDVLGDRFVVFPHLEPFADASRLSTAEISDSLYRTPVYLLLSEGPTAKFSLRLRYSASGGGDRSGLNLNALQIREGSEQLYVGGRKLVRDVDYRISYDVGQVTFIDPDQLFGQGTAQVEARFEERGIFAVAPTSILGMSTRYQLGERSSINLMGLYQREQSAFNRPALGFEATANLIGGANTQLQFRPQAITSFLNSLTSSPTTAPSVLDVNAEFAFSKPDPNRSGEAYLEEFESESGLQVPMREGEWEFGSAPQEAVGLEDIGFAAFDRADAVQLIWQSLVPISSSDPRPIEIRPQDIDPFIRLAGRGEQPEAVLYLTLHADTAGGVVQRDNSSRWTQPRRDNAVRWRSMVTGLSSTGLDLTRNEFLEFWALQPPGDTASLAGLRLVFDLGTVSEDAIAVAPDTMTVNGADTLFTGRQYVGLGELDTERTDVGIFNAAVDDIGILSDRPPIFEIPDGPIGELELCDRTLDEGLLIFPWGDLSARCTNGNGVLDTEDLDGDQLLNAAGDREDVFRYVVDLARGDYHVRDGVTQRDALGRTATWRLYRIPLRAPTAAFGSPNMRLVKHLRITLATPADAGAPDLVAKLAMARMRFLGSPWTRRADAPILGLAGSTGETHGEVSVSVVSTEDRDLGYLSPPGIADQVQTRGGDQQSGGTQINERSLRILGEDLRQGERAEAYLRFPAGPQNLLTYRTLRVWFRGRGPGWAEDDLQAFLKLGSDDDNFYLFRASARTDSWEPEAIIDLETWRRLRADLENRWLAGQGPDEEPDPDCGDLQTTNAFVACEGPYVVHLADPGINPPNLAAVQEVSAGIYRVGATAALDTAELWVDDIRLSDPVSQTGTAMSLDTRLAASDVGNVSAAYTRQSSQFRQISEDPTYRATDALLVTGNLRLDRFLPTSFGVAMPLTVSHARQNVNPELLTGTDLRGDALTGLRKPVTWSTTFALTLRRSRQGTSWLTKGLLDPLAFTGAYTRGRSQTELSDASSSTYALGLTYQLNLRRRGFRLPLGGLGGIVPGDAGKSLRRADFSLVPSRIRFASGLNRDEANATAFRYPVARSDDRLITPTLALNHLWRNSAGLTWQPIGMLNLNGDLTSTRDLRIYPDSTTIGRVAYNSRRFFLGIPVGVERDRNVSTALALTPLLASWLRPRFITSSGFILSRTLSSRDPVRTDGDSGAFILPKTTNNTRANEIGFAVDLGQAFRAASGDSGALTRLLGRVRPVDLSTRITRTSTFDLTAFEPSLKYMLAIGNLENFLHQEGVPALGASEARVANLATGADLPLGFSFTLSHALTRTTRFQRVGESFIPTETRQREWPVGNVRWSHTFRGGPLSLLAIGTGFRRREGNSVQGNRTGTVGATSAIESSTITPDAQLSFRNGVSVTLGYSELDQSSLSNGNNTQLDQNDLTGSLNYAFRLPRSISRLRKQVRTSLNFSSTDALTCLEQLNQTNCIVISDVSRYEVRGGLDTDLLQTVSAGLQVGYSLNDARHLSRRTSQISILASFQLSLFAGDYR
jgi:hypothetical protein